MLPSPEKKEVLEPVRFSVEAGLVHRLGEESVSDPVLAVVELVKNSYDDDAEHVILSLKNLRTGTSVITVTDDGNGMTKEQLADRWMRIATSYKMREPLSPKFKRHRLGRKGVGRFAIENLSTKTIITSYPRNSREGYEIAFKWDDYKPGANLTDVTNSFCKFEKDPKDHGLEIQLLGLRHKWQDWHVKYLQSFLKALVPPAESAPNFEIKVETDEFEELKGVVDSGFLKKAVFVFDATLSKTGEIKHTLNAPTKQTTVEKTSRLADFSCGPLRLKLYFYYREPRKLSSYGISVPSIDDLKNILDDFGGVKIYRDGIRLSGFGNPDDDWTGLDAMSRNDPTVVPSRNQVIASIQISSKDNPEITETTARETLIKNPSFKDMLNFVHTSIGVFAQMRGEIEQKRQPAPKKGAAYVKKALDKIKENRNRKELLDFSDKYPQHVFYKRLEEETNFCYLASLPNATLVLTRKLVENLLYEILYLKFPKETQLRYITAQGRAQDFSVLISNLEDRAHEFEREQQDLINKLLELIKPFKREANATAHKVMEYLETIEELEKLKIPEIVQIELQLVRMLSQ